MKLNKLTTKALIPLLPLIILSGCRSSELKFEGEQCSPVFVYTDETQKLIDVDASYCNTRLYQKNINYVGPVQGSFLKKPLQYCDKCVGFKNYAKAATFWELVRREVSMKTGKKSDKTLVGPYGSSIR